MDVGGLSGDDEAMQLCVDSYCVYLEEAWRAVRLCSTPENPKAQVNLWTESGLDPASVV